MDLSQLYFTITHKEKKKSKKKDSSTGVFCEFCRIFNNTFFKNISSGCFWRWTQRNQTTVHNIQIEQMLSLNDSLWIILVFQIIGIVLATQQSIKSFTFIPQGFCLILKSTFTIFKGFMNGFWSDFRKTPHDGCFC